MSFDLERYERGPRTFLMPGKVYAGVVSEEAGIHGTLMFGYRPMNGLEMGLHKAAMAKLGDVEALKASAKMLAERIAAWNVVGNAGEELAVTQDYVLKLSPLLLAKLLGVVEGYRPSDAIPAPQQTEENAA